MKKPTQPRRLPPTSRRTFLATSSVAAGALMSDLTLHPGAALAGIDDAIAPRHIYAVMTDGTFLVYVDQSSDTAANWTAVAQPVAGPPGVNWAAFTKVFAAGDGVIYAIDAAGALRYFRLLDPWRNGAFAWSTDSNAVIGSGWGEFTSVMAGGDAVLYAVDPNGLFNFFRHSWAAGGLVGTTWANAGNRLEIGNGWQGFPSIVNGHGGTVYAVNGSGALLFYRDHAQVGQGTWVGGTTIGPGGWDSFVNVFSGGNGIIYGIDGSGNLFRYRDRARDGTMNWANGGAGLQIGNGWDATTFKFVLAAPSAHAVEGFVKPGTGGQGSAVTGGKVTVRVSTHAPQYSVRLIRLKRTDSNGNLGADQQSTTVTVGAVNAGNFKKEFHSDMWRQGAPWAADVATLALPSGARPGLWAAELTTPSGGRFLAPFVVKRPARTGRLAVIANTNTWNAYNHWGGGSRYYNVNPFPRDLSYDRPQLAAAQELTEFHVRPATHLTRGEVYVSTWLDGLVASNAAYDYDVHADTDLHLGTVDLNPYKVLIIHTHPEYWSAQMRNALDAYLAGGGHLIYLGGNGLYEMVTVTDAQMRVAQDRPDNLWRSLGRPERAVLGVAFETRDQLNNLSSFYRVNARHAFLTSATGTPLNVSAQFGNVRGCNENQLAAGWETDENGAETPTGAKTLATAAISGGLSHCVYYRTKAATGQLTANGWVFTLASIYLGGALAVDPTLQRIVKNAIDAGLNGVAP